MCSCCEKWVSGGRPAWVKLATQITDVVQVCEEEEEEAFTPLTADVFGFSPTCYLTLQPQKAAPHVHQSGAFSQLW